MRGGRAEVWTASRSLAGGFVGDWIFTRRLAMRLGFRRALQWRPDQLRGSFLGKIAEVSVGRAWWVSRPSQNGRAPLKTPICIPNLPGSVRGRRETCRDASYGTTCPNVLYHEYLVEYRSVSLQTSYLGVFGRALPFYKRVGMFRPRPTLISAILPKKEPRN